MSVAGSSRRASVCCLAAARRSSIWSFLPTVAPWRWHETVKSICCRFQLTHRRAPRKITASFTSAVRQGLRAMVRQRSSDEFSGHATACRAVCDGACTSLAFTADSRQLVMLDCHAEVISWDTGSGQPVGARTLGDHAAVRTALSADGRLAAWVLANGTMHCWDLAADQQLWQRDTAILERYPAFPTALEISPDGRLLVTVYWTDGKYAIHCYDAGTGECFDLVAPAPTAFKGLTVASDELVYSWDSKAVVRAWNVALGCEQWRFSWVPETDR